MGLLNAFRDIIGAADDERRDGEPYAGANDHGERYNATGGGGLTHRKPIPSYL